MPAEKPADFDWVTQRVNCSVFSAFKELERLAQANTATREALLTDKERQTVAFKFAAQGARYFAVLGENLARSVGFQLQADRIEITGDDVPVDLTVTLTLNNEGDCRLRVNGAGEYQPWQVLRMALEELFFDLRPSHHRRT